MLIAVIAALACTHGQACLLSFQSVIYGDHRQVGLHHLRSLAQYVRELRAGVLISKVNLNGYSFKAVFKDAINERYLAITSS